MYTFSLQQSSYYKRYFDMRLGEPLAPLAVDILLNDEQLRTHFTSLICPPWNEA